MLDQADYLVAHNAGFDRNVLHRCCQHAEVEFSAMNFACTVKLARLAWNIRPTRLSDVCGSLGISLNHHHAGSDADACGQIVIAAERAGWSIDLATLNPSRKAR
jgi:DNA polymerase III subunit epsilon